MEKKKQDFRFLTAAVARFDDEMRVRNWSPKTIKSYREALDHFAGFIATSFPEVAAPSAVTAEMISAYQLWLSKRENKVRGGTLSIPAQRSLLNAVRSLFVFCATERIVLLDPTRNLELPKPGRRLPQGVLSPKEIRQLLKQPDLHTYTGLRDRAILEVLYSTGLRNQELRRLRICDVDLDRGYVTILEGKFKKDRVVPLGKVAVHFVREYLTKARPHLIRETGTPQSLLFVSQRGGQLGAEALQRMVKSCAERAGIKKRVFPHGIRHTCATAMLRGRADIRYIQQLLGHASLSSTQIYTHVEIGDLKRVHQRAHPREQNIPPDPEWD